MHMHAITMDCLFILFTLFVTSNIKTVLYSIFFFGFWQKGHDTTTSGITFCLYNIAKHPEVQEKCINEIVSVFGTDGKQPISLSQLNQLAYLDMVIKESLRLYPSVPLIGRKAMEDIKLSMKLFSFS